MNIYYRRETTYCPYPYQDDVQADIVYYSKSKKNFNAQVFMTTPPIADVKIRKDKVANFLKLKKRSITLIRA